jgi:hypothetical protein
MALLLVAVGCGRSHVEHGNANVTVNILGSASAVSRVSIEVVGAGAFHIPVLRQDLVQTGSARWQGLLTGIPAGAAQAFRAIARDARGVAVFTKEVVASVPAGGTVDVYLTLGGEAGDAPIIDLVLVPPTARVNETIQVQAFAHDPLRYTLSYWWSSTCGLFADPAVLSPLWTAPPIPGTCSLTLTADNGHGRSTSSTVPVIVLQLDGSADVDVTVLQPPVLTVLATLDLDAEMTGTLEVVASDPSPLLDPAWVTTGCPGLVLDEAPPRSAFTPAVKMVGPSPACTVLVSVSDVVGAFATASVRLPPNCVACAAGQVCGASGTCGAGP